VIDQRLMHGPQHDRFFARRQPLDVPEIQLPVEHGRLVNHPDLLQVRANRPPDGRGVGVDPLGMQQHELSELKPPDMPRPGQQSHDGVEFLVGERVVGPPHFELLLQFAYPQQREAFITEPDDFLFQQLEDPRTYLRGRAARTNIGTIKGAIELPMLRTDMAKKKRNTGTTKKKTTGTKTTTAKKRPTAAKRAKRGKTVRSQKGTRDSDAVVQSGDFETVKGHLKNYVKRFPRCTTSHKMGTPMASQRLRRRQRSVPSNLRNSSNGTES